MDRTIWQQWRAQRQELQAQLPQQYAYLLIDAAQLPLNCMPWREMVAAGEVFNLLGKQPEGCHPEVCALLATDAALWTDALVASHIERRPFAFMLLHSHQLHQQLGAILARATAVKLPRRRKGLLRFYDAAVFDGLQASLSANNFQQLLSCAQAWTYVDRSARMQTVHHRGPHPGWALSALLLSDDELHALQLIGSPQRIAAQLKKNGHLSVNADPFDTNAKLQLLIDALPPLADNDSRDALLYRCSALSLQQPLSAWRSQVPALVQRHAQDLQALGNAMMDWGQATSFNAIS